MLAGTLRPEATAAVWLGNWFARDVADLTQFYRTLNGSLFG